MVEGTEYHISGKTLACGILQPSPYHSHCIAPPEHANVRITTDMLASKYAIICTFLD